MKHVRLSLETTNWLKRLTTAQLVVLSKYADDADFPVLIDIANDLIDFEKDVFFGEKEYDKEKLHDDHLRARSRVGMIVEFLKIIKAAKSELATRKQE